MRLGANWLTHQLSMHPLCFGLLSCGNSNAISFRNWKFIRKRSQDMKQRWLIVPLPASDATPTIELASHTHEELVALMAIAIESMHLQQANLPQQAKEAHTDDRIAATSQD
jgi:hypothetical protein